MNPDGPVSDPATCGSLEAEKYGVVYDRLKAVFGAKIVDVPVGRLAEALAGLPWVKAEPGTTTGKICKEDCVIIKRTQLKLLRGAAKLSKEASNFIFSPKMESDVKKIIESHIIKAERNMELYNIMKTRYEVSQKALEEESKVTKRYEEVLQKMQAELNDKVAELFCIKQKYEQRLAEYQKTSTAKEKELEKEVRKSKAEIERWRAKVVTLEESRSSLRTQLKSMIRKTSGGIVSEAKPPCIVTPPSSHESIDWDPGEEYWLERSQRLMNSSPCGSAPGTLQDTDTLSAQCSTIGDDSEEQKSGNEAIQVANTAAATQNEEAESCSDKGIQAETGSEPACREGHVHASPVDNDADMENSIVPVENLSDSSDEESTSTVPKTTAPKTGALETNVQRDSRVASICPSDKKASPATPSETTLVPENLKSMPTFEFSIDNGCVSNMPVLCHQGYGCDDDEDSLWDEGIPKCMDDFVRCMEMVSPLPESDSSPQSSQDLDNFEVEPSVQELGELQTATSRTEQISESDVHMELPEMSSGPELQLESQRHIPYDLEENAQGLENLIGPPGALPRDETLPDDIFSPVPEPVVSAPGSPEGNDNNEARGIPVVRDLLNGDHTKQGEATSEPQGSPRRHSPIDESEPVADSNSQESSPVDAPQLVENNEPNLASGVLGDPGLSSSESDVSDLEDVPELQWIECDIAATETVTSTFLVTDGVDQAVVEMCRTSEIMGMQSSECGLQARSNTDFTASTPVDLVIDGADPPIHTVPYSADSSEEESLDSAADGSCVDGVPSRQFFHDDNLHLLVSEDNGKSKHNACTFLNDMILIQKVTKNRECGDDLDPVDSDLVPVDSEHTQQPEPSEHHQKEPAQESTKGNEQIRNGGEKPVQTQNDHLAHHEIQLLQKVLEEHTPVHNRDEEPVDFESLQSETIEQDLVEHLMTSSEETQVAAAEELQLQTECNSNLPVLNLHSVVPEVVLKKHAKKHASQETAEIGEVSPKRVCRRSLIPISTLKTRKSLHVPQENFTSQSQQSSEKMPNHTDFEKLDVTPPNVYLNGPKYALNQCEGVSESLCEIETAGDDLYPSESLDDDQKLTQQRVSTSPAPEPVIPSAVNSGHQPENSAMDLASIVIDEGQRAMPPWLPEESPMSPEPEESPMSPSERLDDLQKLTQQRVSTSPPPELHSPEPVIPSVVKSGHQPENSKMDLASNSDSKESQFVIDEGQRAMPPWLPEESPMSPEPEESPMSPEPEELPLSPEPEESPLSPEPEESPLSPEPVKPLVAHNLSNSALAPESPEYAVCKDARNSLEVSVNLPVECSDSYKMVMSPVQRKSTGLIFGNGTLLSKLPLSDKSICLENVTESYQSETLNDVADLPESEGIALPSRVTKVLKMKRGKRKGRLHSKDLFGNESDDEHVGVKRFKTKAAPVMNDSSVVSLKSSVRTARDDLFGEGSDDEPLCSRWKSSPCKSDTSIVSPPSPGSPGPGIQDTLELSPLSPGSPGREIRDTSGLSPTSPGSPACKIEDISALSPPSQQLPEKAVNGKQPFLYVPVPSPSPILPSLSHSIPTKSLEARSLFQPQFGTIDNFAALGQGCHQLPNRKAHTQSQAASKYAEGGAETNGRSCMQAKRMDQPGGPSVASTAEVPPAAQWRCSETFAMFRSGSQTKTRQDISKLRGPSTSMLNKPVTRPGLARGVRIPVKQLGAPSPMITGPGQMLPMRMLVGGGRASVVKPWTNGTPSPQGNDQGWFPRWKQSRNFSTIPLIGPNLMPLIQKDAQSMMPVKEEEGPTTQLETTPLPNPPQPSLAPSGISSSLGTSRGASPHQKTASGQLPNPEAAVPGPSLAPSGISSTLGSSNGTSPHQGTASGQLPNPGAATLRLNTTRATKKKVCVFAQIKRDAERRRKELLVEKTRIFEECKEMQRIMEDVPDYTESSIWGLIGRMHYNAKFPNSVAVAKAFVEMLSKDITITERDLPIDPPLNTFLSSFVAKLLEREGRTYVTLVDDLLDELCNYVAGFTNKMSHCQEGEIRRAGHLAGVLCKDHKNLNRARDFCFDAILHGLRRACSPVFGIVQTWPELWPKKGEEGDHETLFHTMAYAVFSREMKGHFQDKMCEYLKSRGYSADDYTDASLMEKLMHDLTNGDRKKIERAGYGIVLLARVMKWKWVQSELLEGAFAPYLQIGSTKDNRSVCGVLKALRLVTSFSRKKKPAFANQLLQPINDFLRPINAAIVPRCVQEAAVEALTRLEPGFNSRVGKILHDWYPDFVVSEHLMKRMSDFAESFYKMQKVFRAAKAFR